MRTTLASVSMTAGGGVSGPPQPRQQQQQPQADDAPRGDGAGSSSSVAGGGGGGSNGGWAARGSAPQALFSLARVNGPGPGQQPAWGPDRAAVTAGGKGGGGAAVAGGELDLDLDRAQAVVSELIGGGGGRLGGSEDETEGGTAAEEAVLSRAECSFCRKRLGRSSSRRASPDVLLCDGCHRGFHADCCRYRGLDIRRQRSGTGEAGGADSGSGSGAWYHCQDCAECAAQWRARAAAGPAAAAGGRSWLLLSTDLTSTSTSTSQPAVAQSGAQQQLQQRRRQKVVEALEQAAAVLSSEYGPRVVDAVLDSDHAVLLRDARGLAVSAATLDVYGREVVVMDLAATAEEARGRGHFRALVTSLESWLQEAQTQHWVVALAPGKDGKAMQQMWRERGFRPLAGRQAHMWARQLPGFPETSGGGGGRGRGGGSMLLAKRLAAAGAGEGAEEEGEGARRRRGPGGVLRRAVGGVVGGVAGAVRGVVGYVLLADR
ncbi:hypothetical protein PLESTF_001429500 [Pleodorina starrii]|nr:hypothetical protein PLESTM_000553800 [Pleodorina starrii]GLC73865.1 hypothetical protein PLESTF_001429500 [Pleodorina starrii]